MSRLLTLAAGVSITALSALPQYTISARPGVINSITGTAYINGTHITDAKAAQRMFLNANDTLATDAGKAEVLLTPGVYLRVGDHSEVKMISPSLTDTQFAVTKGTAMVEAMELLKENSVRVHVGETVAKLEKAGLYRFAAGDAAAVSVFDGKASVEQGNGKAIEIGKERELALNGSAKTEKFKVKDEQGDDLYAWSKTRDEYDSASSYAASKTLATSSYTGGGWGGYGFSGFNGYGGPGWFYNPMFGSYAWLPGDGAFFSPFGYGFYSPGYVMYAPVVYSNLGGGVRGTGVAVPVNVNHVPTVAGSTGQRPTVMMPAYRAGAPMMTGVAANGGHISGNAMSRSIGTGSSAGAARSGGTAGGGGIAPAGRSMGGSSMSGGARGGASGGGHR